MVRVKQLLIWEEIRQKIVLGRFGDLSHGSITWR